MKYEIYLRTRHWKKKKHELFLFRGGKCQRCNFRSLNEEDFDGHHNTYKNLWNEDVEKDLLLVDRRCHYKINHPHRKRNWKQIRPSDILNFIIDLYINAYALKNRRRRGEMYFVLQT